MNCPRCEQGEILLVEISKNQQQLFLCEECEAIWFKGMPISKHEFYDFGTYLKSLSIQPIWKEITIVRENL